MMKRRINFIFAGLIILIASHSVEAAENLSLSFLPDSRIQLNGDSTLRKYSSTAKVLALTGTAINQPVAQAGLPWTPTEVKMILDIKNLKSGEETLDEHMRENLKSAQHPEIQLKLSSFSFKKNEDKSIVTAVGTLSLAGVSKAIELEANLKIEGENLKITGVKKVLMSDYGIAPPKMMMGALKTADEVEISFEVICSINNNKKG